MSDPSLLPAMYRQKGVKWTAFAMNPQHEGPAEQFGGTEVGSVRFAKLQEIYR